MTPEGLRSDSPTNHFRTACTSVHADCCLQQRYSPLPRPVAHECWHPPPVTRRVPPISSRDTTIPRRLTTDRDVSLDMRPTSRVGTPGPRAVWTSQIWPRPKALRERWHERQHM